MQQQIHGIQNHPDQNTLAAYSAEVPAGVWQGRLDYQAWGKSTNLFCYFTDTTSGERYRLSVFSRGSYKPYNGGPAFDQEEIGGVFEVTTALSKNGLAKFMAAEKVSF